MTGETLRRSNWTANEMPVRRSQLESRPASQEDPLAELERIVMRGDPFAERARSLPSNVEPFPARRESYREEAPPHRREEPLVARRSEEPRPRPAVTESRPEDIFGVDEAAFEAALRGATSPAPVAAPEPRFTEIDVAQFDQEFARPRAEAPAARAQSAPAVPAQPTRDAFDREFLQGLDRELSSQEPALFVESTEPQVDSEEAPEEDAAPRRGRGLVTVAAVCGLVALGVGAAVGFTMVTGGARAPSGEPVVVRADDRPTRIVPQAENDPNKVIQDRLTAQAPASAERVIPREEEPVEALTQPTRADPRTGVPQGAEPRRVTTTTIRVRPDGTMESEPTRPQMALASAPRTTATTSQPAGRPAEQAAAPVRPEPQAPTELAAPAVSVPVPPSRPERAPAQAEQPAPQPTQLASVSPQQTGRNIAGPLVQISSQPSEEGARNALSDLQRRFPQIVGGRQSNIRSAQAGERTVYRVRVGGFSSRDEAAQFCQRLRSAGGDCFVVPN